MSKLININNSFHSDNYNTYCRQHDYYLVNKQNSDKVARSLQHNDGKNNLYVIERGNCEDYQLETQVLQSNGGVIYYTKSTVPTDFMARVTNYKHTMFLYELPTAFTLTDDLCSNLRSAFSVASTAFVARRLNEPWEMLFCRLCKARYYIDRVFLDYQQLDIDKIFDDYLALHEPLARWRMYLYLPYDNVKQQQTLNKYKGVKK